MNNFALDQIIGFLHYIASKEMKGSNFRIKCFHIIKDAFGKLNNM